MSETPMAGASSLGGCGNDSNYTGTLRASSTFSPRDSVASNAPMLMDHYAANNTSTTAAADNNNSYNLSPPSAILSCYERFYNRYLLLFFVCMTNFFVFFDRGSMTSMILDIRNDKEIAGGDHKSLSETQGSLVVSAYMVGFVLSGPVCSALGRVVNARWIMSAGLLIVFSTSFLTGLSYSYTMLLAVRAANGFGEAAIGAYFLTMVDNCATPKTRTLWIGMYFVSTPLGTFIGTAVSGYIAANLTIGTRAAWRFAFYLASVGGFPFALMAMLYPSRFSPTSVGLAPGRQKGAVAAEEEEQQLQRREAVVVAVADGSGGSSLPKGSEEKPLLSPNTSMAATTPTVDNKGSGAPAIDLYASTSEAVPSSDGALLVGGGEAGSSEGSGGGDGDIVDREFLLLDDDKYAHARPIDAIKRLVTSPVFASLVVAMAFFYLVSGAAGVVTQSMLRFGPWKMSQELAGTITGFAAVPSILGSLAGGHIVDRLGGTADPKGLFRCCRHLAMMALLSLAVLISALFVYDIVLYTLMQFVGTFALMTVIGPTTAAMMSAVDKDVRTYAMSYAVIFERLIALPGPTIIGYMADYFSDGCHGLNYQHMCEGAGNTTTSAFTATTMTAMPTTTLYTTTATAVPSPSPLPYARSDRCVWVPGKQGANGSCMNELEGRNASAYLCFLHAFTIGGWTVAALFAYRRYRVWARDHGMGAGSVEEEEGVATTSYTLGE